MERQPCPFCAEEIQSAARRCPHCRSRLEPFGPDRWHRDHAERRLAGVAAGNPPTTRLPPALGGARVVALALLPFAGPILYAALWVTMPDGPHEEPIADRAIDLVRDLFGPKHRRVRPGMDPMERDAS